MRSWDWKAVCAGLDVSAEAFREKKWKASPIWHASGKTGNLALGRVLLDRGADPDYTLWPAGMRDATMSARSSCSSTRAPKWISFRALAEALATD